MFIDFKLDRKSILGFIKIHSISASTMNYNYNITLTKSYVNNVLKVHPVSSQSGRVSTKSIPIETFGLWRSERREHFADRSIQSGRHCVHQRVWHSVRSPIFQRYVHTCYFVE